LEQASHARSHAFHATANAQAETGAARAGTGDQLNGWSSGTSPDDREEDAVAAEFEVR